MTSRNSFFSFSFLFISLVFISSLSAQTIKQIPTLQFKQAGQMLKNGAYEKALENYLALLSDTAESKKLKKNEKLLNYYAAMCYYYLPDKKDKAIPHFKKFLEEPVSDSLYQAHLFLGEIMLTSGHYDEAIKEFESFRSHASDELRRNRDEDPEVRKNVELLVTQYIDNCNYAKMLVQNPNDVIIDNLGDSINTKYSEYAPVISSKEGDLFFARRSPQSTGSKLSPDNDYFEDIYYSKITGGSLYSENGNELTADKNKNGITPFKATIPVNIGAPVNTENHEAPLQLSADGKTLYIYKRSAIWKSELADGKWQKPTKLNLKGVFDKKSFEPGVSISTDGKTIFFSSNRKGGYGGLDIYVTNIRRNGTWTTPENLGPTVNTPFDEDAPYTDIDETVLYFASKGHSSMGGYDIFKSVKKDNSWSEAQNMGYPLNSSGDDIFYTMTPDFNRAYYSSERPGGKGKMDIYRVTFENEKKSFSEITGIVSANDTLIPPHTTFTFTNEKNEIVSAFSADDKTGKFHLLVGNGKKYYMTVETKGFEPFTREISGEKKSEVDQQLVENIRFLPLADRKGNVIGQKAVALRNFNDHLSPYVTENEKTAADNTSVTTEKQKFKKDFPSLASGSKAPKTIMKEEVLDAKFFISENLLGVLIKRGMVDSTLYKPVLVSSNDTIYRNYGFPATANVTFTSNKDGLLANAFTPSRFSHVKPHGKKIVPENTAIASIAAKKTEHANASKSDTNIVHMAVSFEPESYAINPQAKEMLNEYAQFLKQHPGYEYELIGHSDDKASDSYNDKLSMNRAQAVYTYLCSAGVPSKKMRLKAVGARYPVSSDENNKTTNDPRKLNRTVEIKMVAHF